MKELIGSGNGVQPQVAIVENLIFQTNPKMKAGDNSQKACHLVTGAASVRYSQLGCSFMTLVVCVATSGQWTFAEARSAKGPPGPRMVRLWNHHVVCCLKMDDDIGTV